MLHLPECCCNSQDPSFRPAEYLPENLSAADVHEESSILFPPLHSDDTDSLAHGQLHRNIIKQQCFSGSWKSAEPEISSSFSTYSLQNLPFNISLLGSKEILFFEKTLRFCQRRDQIKLCLKQILDISLIVRAFFPQCNT